MDDNGKGRVMRPGHGYGYVALVQQFWSGIWNLCCRVLRLSDISTLVQCALHVIAFALGRVLQGIGGQR